MIKKIEETWESQWRIGIYLENNYVDILKLKTVSKTKNALGGFNLQWTGLWIEGRSIKNIKGQWEQRMERAEQCKRQVEHRWSSIYEIEVPEV